MALGAQFANSIFKEDINKSTEKHVKGCYTDNRNYKIACRFYYYFNIKGLRYERTLTVLHDEFDLSELRIAQLIMGAGDHLEKLKQDNADKKYLANKLPHYNWN
ncbi:hypothetical protein [Mucilaginibacter sp.]|uniref:hypothetical protein n=1 Tax=Mucilaginibacter sp. TaxID=1882438 RepID=UPI002630D6F8|nr:hypothetical protein [Mucilaginibacter sp.]MDB5029728.1 hypothetical protein [Mucilaginibacter sp.]